MSAGATVRRPPAETNDGARGSGGLSAAWLLAPVVWQAWVVGVAWLRFPRLQALFVGLGGSLPFLTSSFLACYRFLPLVPTAFLLVSLDLLARPRRGEVSLARYAAVLIASAGSALALQIWMDEAEIGPFIAVLWRVG